MYALHKWGCQYHCHPSAGVWSPRGQFLQDVWSVCHVGCELMWAKLAQKRHSETTTGKPRDMATVEDREAPGRRGVTKTTRDCIKDKNPSPVLSLATRITFLNPSPTRKFHSILVSLEEAIIVFPTSTVCSMCSIQPRGSLSAPITASKQQTLQASLPWKNAADNNS